jgi:hypothetical protein
LAIDRSEPAKEQDAPVGHGERAEHVDQPVVK